ncbi:MAG: ATP-binding protein [Bradyrhizobium sp.]|nr:ATP-binding protein [Bradyrhizobium sp.]
MPFNFSVALLGGQDLQFQVNAGEIVFVLGANGTGKSSLLHRFYAANRQNSRRITAHRQTWFDSNAIQVTGRQKRDQEANMQAWDADPNSRWRDQFTHARANLAIYDLLDTENVRARKIAAAVDEDNLALAKTLSKVDAPIKIINELLKLSALPIEISVQQSEQVFASKNGSAPYSVAELSDGERNALLLAADVLTAKSGALFIVDEPERHLHRSIISPLLTLLFERRNDCAFIVSTHDVLLPIDNPRARILLLRSCVYLGPNVVRGWDADLVATPDKIDDTLKRDILGSRRHLLFVEGEERSLDKPIYSLLFPAASVIAKQRCRDEEHAVTGIRDSSELPWLKAFGIIDGDNRDAAEIGRLKGRGVYAVPAISVEAIYYHPFVQQQVCQRQAKVTGGDAGSLILEASKRALESFGPHVQRLSERVAEAKIRADLMSKLPKRKDIATALPIDITLNVSKIVSEEKVTFEAAIARGDLGFIVSRYPVRESSALGLIAETLGFKSRAQYESAVRQLLIDSPDALSYVRGLFGTLSDDIAAN